MIEGKILTIIDASVSDPIQRKAMKDIASSEIWSWASQWNYGYDEEQWNANQSLGGIGKIVGFSSLSNQPGGTTSQ